MKSSCCAPRLHLNGRALERSRQVCCLLRALGLETNDYEIAGHVIATYFAADANGATSAPGVCVAGNVADPMAQVITAAAAGLKAGAGINADLIAEETTRAVVAFRAQSPAPREPFSVYSEVQPDA